MTPAQLRSGLSGLSALALALKLDRDRSLADAWIRAGRLRIRSEVGEHGVRYTFIPALEKPS